MIRHKFLLYFTLLLGAGLIAAGLLFRSPPPRSAAVAGRPAPGQNRRFAKIPPAPPAGTVIPRPAPAPELGPLVENDPPREFPGAQVLQEVIEPKPDGGFERRRLLRVNGPYPLVRAVEHYVRNGPAGFQREKIEAMLADSVIVARPEESTPEQFHARLANLGFSAGPQYHFSPVVRVFASGPTDLNTVPAALARLHAEAPALTVEPDILHFTQTGPNDYDGRQQWGLEIIGAPAAWNTSTGSNDLIAATIDTGIDLQHPDLQANIWSNPGEISNGRDDDGNGLIDDLHGWNFADNNNDPTDKQGHGTHVAGIIGAVGNNGLGVTGVAWRVKLLALRCGDTSLATSAVIQALDYLSNLKQHGLPIVVVNNSYGSGSSISTQRDSIVRAQQQGILFIAAAGNDARNIDGAQHTFPVGYGVNNIVGVAASNLADGLADYSNWGTNSVLLAAPGSGILSTLPGGKYGVLDGTSMSTPMVTGAAILLKAAQPTLDYTGLRTRLVSMVTPVPALADKVASGGRLNLQQLIAPNTVVPQISWVTPTVNLVAVEDPSFPINLTVHAVQVLNGDEVGTATVLWQQTFGPGTSTFDTAVTPGQTTAHFSLPGLYQVRATATAGQLSVTADKAVAIGTTAISTNGLSARWTFDETSGPALDSSGNGHTATLANNPTRDTGPMGLAALRFNGVSTGAYFNAPASSQVTLAGWIRMETPGNSVFPRLLNFPSYYLFPGRDTTVAAPDANRGTIKFLAHWSDTDGVFYSTPDLVGDGSWYHLAATYDNTAGVRSLPHLYLNGIPLSTAVQAAAVGTAAPTAGTGYMGNNADQTRALNGALADVRIYGRELHPAEIALLVAEPALADMRSWNLVVVSSAPQAAILQLRKSDGRVPGEGQAVIWEQIDGPAAATFGIANGGQVNVAVPTQGSYTVTVGLVEGSARMERRFTLDLPGTAVPPVAPGFVHQPLGRMVATGGTLQLTCEASGSPPLSYQWFKDGQAIPGAISAQLTIGGAQLSDAGQYFATVSNAAGSVTSQTAVVQVLDPPTITTAPIGQTVAQGSQTRLTVVAKGSPPLTYQWRFNGAALAGATNSTLVLDNIGFLQSGTYTVLVSNPVGSVVSPDAVIHVLVPPSILTQPSSKTLVSGSTFSMDVTVQGDPPLTFQWFKNGQPVNGANDPTLRFLVIRASDSGDYRLRVQNIVGEAFTDIITLTILDPPVITQQPVSQSVRQGDGVTLAVTVAGSAPLQYQWSKDYGILTGQTNAQLILNNLQTSDAGGYTVKITNAVGWAISDMAYVGVITPPQILRNPVGGAVAPGGGINLSINPDGPASSFYITWLQNGQPLLASNGAQLQLDNIQPGQTGLYVAEVTSAGGTTFSQPAVVGLIPTARTAGMVTTQPEWQNIHHANGNVYDQFLLTGEAGTFTADPGQIARLSFLDLQGNIVQVELSGAGAATVVLTGATGPSAPTLYQQPGILYMQGIATVILAGAGEDTHLSIYSVGRLNNPGVTRTDITYDGWANVSGLGILGNKLGGLHLGDVLFAASSGPTGIYAPSSTPTGTVVLHDINASREAQPYLFFAAQGQVGIKIAGGDLAQSNGNPVLIAGLAQVVMGAGQGSSGQAAPAQAIRGILVRDGIDVTMVLVSGH
jgi:subtilisin family serine protease